MLTSRSTERMIYNCLILAVVANALLAREIFHRIAYQGSRGAVYQKTFYLSPTYIRASWHNAEDFCKRHGMRFATVRTENEQAELFRYLERNRIYFDHIWTSLRDMNDDNRWTWSVQPADTLKYVPNWNKRSKEPDAGKNHTCGHISFDTIERFTWGDYTCDDEYGFLCEIEERGIDESCDGEIKITNVVCL